MNYDHGARLNAQASAMDDALFERSVVLDQLTEIFFEDGLEVGGRWYNRADATIYMLDSDAFSDWERRCMEPGLNDQAKVELMAEYDRMLEDQYRTYVDEVLEPMIDEEMREDAL